MTISQSSILSCRNAYRQIVLETSPVGTVLERSQNIKPFTRSFKLLRGLRGFTQQKEERRYILTERADQLNKVDFASLALSVFSGKQEEIVLPDLPSQEDFERRVLFLGEWTGDDTVSQLLDVPEEILKDGQFERDLLEGLTTGKSIWLDLSGVENLEIAAIIYDAFYGVMLSESFKSKTSEFGLSLGKLELLIPEDTFLFDFVEFIGEVLWATIMPMVEQKFLGPSKVFAKLYGILQTELSFFLPVSNVFVSKIMEGEIGKYDSFLNYDNHWGGLLGWYRLEYAIRLVSPEFRFNFPEEVRKELDEIVIDKILKLKWLHRAIEDLLNDKGNTTFKDMIDFYLDFYEMEILSD